MEAYLRQAWLLRGWENVGRLTQPGHPFIGKHNEYQYNWDVNTKHSHCMMH